MFLGIAISTKILYVGTHPVYLLFLDPASDFEGERSLGCDVNDSSDRLFLWPCLLAPKLLRAGPVTSINNLERENKSVMIFIT